MLGKFLIQAAANNAAAVTPGPTPTPTPVITNWILKILDNNDGDISILGDNLYYYGKALGAGAGYLMKYTLDGSLSWQRQFSTGALRTFKGQGINASSNGIYLTGTDTAKGTYGSPDAKIVMVKYNNTGSLLWSKALERPSGSTAKFPNMSASPLVDSSGNIYIVGATDDLVVIKYSPLGTLEWQKSYSLSNVASVNSVIGPDGNLYVSAYCYGNNVPTVNTAIYKISPEGIILTTYQINNLRGKAIFLDDESKIYVSGELVDSGEKPTIVKINQSAPWAIEWQKVITSEQEGLVSGYSSIGMSGNEIYFFGTRTFAIDTNVGLPMLTYDKTGLFVRARKIGDLNGYVTSTDFAIDSSNNIYPVFRSQENTPGLGNQNMFVTKLPNDGTKTGTYPGDYEEIFYESESITTTDGSLTLASVTPTTSNYTLEEVDITISDSSSSVQYAKTNI